MTVVGWWVAAVFTVACVAHILWHWPVRRQMAVEDWMVRGGLLILMADVVACAVCLVSGVRRLTVAEWVAAPALSVAGSAIVGGFVTLLWKFRYHRDTAALQPNVGTPPPRDEN